MKNLKIWISAFRLRTLPLAFASIVLGSLLAAGKSLFNWRVALLCFVTAILLQILTNLANDYGDSIHGADSDKRAGPERATQSGKISRPAMRKAVLICVGLCLAIGYILIRHENLLFHAAGLAAIAAAIAYTAGPKPYGYIGLGDIFVFMFFGIVGVCGSYYLHTHDLNFWVLLPASACGCFCVAVLNINNIRDLDSDEVAGKITIPVRLGLRGARVYHWFLLLLGLGTAITHLVFTYHSPWQLLFLLSLPLLLKNGIGVSRPGDASELDAYLKQMAVATMVFCLCFGLGNLL